METVLISGTLVIIIITAQLRFRLGRKQVVPYYPYMAQAKIFMKCLAFKEVLLNSKELQVHNGTDSDIKDF